MLSTALDLFRSVQEEKNFFLLSFAAGTREGREGKGRSLDPEEEEGGPIGEGGPTPLNQESPMEVPVADLPLFPQMERDMEGK